MPRAKGSLSRRPGKRIFKKSSKDEASTSEFNDAIAQIGVWRDFIDQHHDQLLRRLTGARERSRLHSHSAFPKCPLQPTIQDITVISAGPEPPGDPVIMWL